MENLKKFNEYYNYDYDYTKDINNIISFLEKENIEYSDLSRTKNSLYFYLPVIGHPISFTFNIDDIIIVVEVDGVTKNMGTYGYDEIEEYILYMIKNNNK